LQSSRLTGEETMRTNDGSEEAVAWLVAWLGAVVKAWRRLLLRDDTLAFTRGTVNQL
jgi:hypothetical protein